MQRQLLGKIKKYAFFSFILPLIAINLCLLLYMWLGHKDIVTFHNTFVWTDSKQEISIDKWDGSNSINQTYTNCPKYKVDEIYMHSFDNKVLQVASGGKSIIESETKKNAWEKANLIKYVSVKYSNEPNISCVKNNKILNSIFLNFPFLESLLIKTTYENAAGFAKIKSPYYSGHVSISRTARYFPAYFIFKPLIILSSLLLFFYWKSNLALLSELKNKNIVTNFSKKFIYYGSISALFLFLHAVFLGLDFDSKIFDKLRRLILVIFIFSEIIAQFLLTKNLFKIKKILVDINIIRPIILNIKILFIGIVVIGSVISFYILAFNDPSTSFKHILEWNYFSFLVLYYYLSRLLWK